MNKFITIHLLIQFPAPVNSIQTQNDPKTISIKDYYTYFSLFIHIYIYLVIHQSVIYMAYQPYKLNYSKWRHKVNRS